MCHFWIESMFTHDNSGFVHGFTGGIGKLLLIPILITVYSLLSKEIQRFINTLIYCSSYFFYSYRYGQWSSKHIDRYVTIRCNHSTRSLQYFQFSL